MIRLILTRFHELGSARQVLLSMKADQIHFPRLSDEGRLTSFDWVAIRYRNVIAVLKNPFYAGVYVYGKSEKRTSIVDDPGAEALRSPGFTPSDDALIDNNLAVFPFAASVNDIGFDGLERSYLAASSDDAGQKARRRHRVEWGDRCAAPWMTRPNRVIDALSLWAYRKQDLGAVA